jgi:hypothetical protein
MGNKKEPKNKREETKGEKRQRRHRHFHGRANEVIVVDQRPLLTMARGTKTSNNLQPFLPQPPSPKSYQSV